MAASRSLSLNLFDFWAQSSPTGRVKNSQDLEGRQLAAARSTQLIMFEWLRNGRRRHEQDRCRHTAHRPARLCAGRPGRRRAALGPAYTILISRKRISAPSTTGPRRPESVLRGVTRSVPGRAAHQDWIEQNKALIPRLYKAYEQAAKWLTANPDEAAKLITPKSTPTDQAALAASIRANSRLGLSLASAAEVRKEIQAVYRAGVESSPRTEHHNVR